MLITPIWGYPKQCPKGTVIENVIVNNDISLQQTIHLHSPSYRFDV